MESRCGSMIDIDPQLQSSYAACRRMHRRFDPTYYWATRRLPREIRPAVHALYGFVRGADELVDGPRRPPDPAARRAALDRWERELDDGLERGRSSHPVIAALPSTRRFNPRWWQVTELSERNLGDGAWTALCKRIETHAWI